MKLTHLLRNHDYERGHSRTTDPRNSEQLSEASDVVALANNGGLDLKLGVDVVQITGGLNWMKSKPQQRLVCLVILVLFHQLRER